MVRFLSFLLITTILACGSAVYAACPTMDGVTAIGFLKGCSTDSSEVAVIKDVAGTTGVKQLIVDVAKKILQFGALFAVGAIVFSGIRYTTSAGDDEKLKSAKNIATYAIIGLLLLLTAFPLVDILIGFVYSLGQ